MSDYYDEPYYEPTAADEIFFEAREKLIKSLKDSVKQHIENIENENKKLKDKNEKLSVQVREIEYRERKLELEKKNLESTVRRERLSVLLEQLKVERFMVKTKTMYEKKCNKCNSERYVEFLSPLGKKQKERCDCYTNRVEVFLPESHLCTEFKVDSQNSNKLRMWYRLNSYNKDEYYSSSTYYQNSYDGEPYESLSIYSTFFDTLEECQKYCDWLNRDIDFEKYTEIE